MKSKQGRTYKDLIHGLRVMRRGHRAGFLQMSAQVPEMADPDAREIDNEDRTRHDAVDVQPRAQRLHELGRVFCG